MGVYQRENRELAEVEGKGLDYERWKETLDWMIEEQEMEALEPDERELITKYLAKFYGPERLARTLAKRP